MFLLILDNVGTSELILVGIVALIFLGPRRLPEIARKFGKLMAEFRSTTSEFKATWEREVNFEEEEKALRAAFDDEPSSTVRRKAAGGAPPIPEIRSIDRDAFEALAPKAIETSQNTSDDVAKSRELPDIDAAPETGESSSDKRSWL